jgi:hypothetical protein
VQTSSPRWSNLQLPRPPIADLSLTRAFTLRGGVRFAIVGRAFNVANTPWPGFGGQGPEVNLNPMSASFGALTGRPGNATRQFAVIGKLDW